MTATRKPIKQFIYPLCIVLCLLVSLALLYINFSDFVMPYALVVGLLIASPLISLISYIAWLRLPRRNHGASARSGRVVVMILFGIVVAILIALPVLVIQNA